MNVGPRAGLEEMLLAVVLGRKNDPTLLGFAADQFSVAGLCPRAMGMYRRALDITPDNVQLRINTSLCLLRLGKLDEARALAVAGMPRAADDTGLMNIVTLSDSLITVRRQRLASVSR
ncbi:MAG TPA: tetratricopeptide repeat protein [Steroidobacteraceae bacterium]|nr:tetratricopeptide repeat protein [Steroidobacteraceae bacterium]